MAPSEDTMILVCDNCYRASCLLGEFYCDQARQAGVVWVHIKDLKNLNLESPEYWEDSRQFNFQTCHYT